MGAHLEHCRKIEVLTAERDALKAELDDYKFQTKHAVDLWKSIAETAEGALERIAEGYSYKRHSGMDSGNVTATRDGLRREAVDALAAIRGMKK